jgi:predicted amidohydrolase
MISRFVFAILFFSFAALAKSPVRVTMLPYPISYNLSESAFLEKTESFVRVAAAEGTDLVVFPELLSFDLIQLRGPSTRAQAERIAREFSPHYVDALKEWSRRYNVAIFGGTTPWLLTAEPAQVVNRAFLVFADGQVFEQDKNFLTPDEKSEYSWTPSFALPRVFETPLGRIVVLICYDAEFPAISQSLAAQSPELIIVPSMTSPDGFDRVRVTAQARAVEHHAYVLVAGTVDAPNSPLKHFTGNAAVFEPYDFGYRGIKAQGVLDAPTPLRVELDLIKLRATKLSSGFYPGRDQSQRARVMGRRNSSL